MYLQTNIPFNLSNDMRSKTTCILIITQIRHCCLKCYILYVLYLYAILLEILWNLYELLCCFVSLIECWDGNYGCESAGHLSVHLHAPSVSLCGGPWFPLVLSGQWRLCVCGRAASQQSAGRLEQLTAQ